MERKHHMLIFRDNLNNSLVNTLCCFHRMCLFVYVMQKACWVLCLPSCGGAFDKLEDIFTRCLLLCRNNKGVVGINTEAFQSVCFQCRLTVNLWQTWFMIIVKDGKSLECVKFWPRIVRASEINNDLKKKKFIN